MSPRLLRLAAIATAAGAFSGLFDVGGGTIIVPQLVLWLAYDQKEATGTSLAAIIVIGSGSPQCRSCSPCSSRRDVGLPSRPLKR
jgi:uncharacterized membrane protein YfcA